MEFNYEIALNELKSRDANDVSEEDVKAEIVEPVLRYALGYESQYIRRENQLNAKRPDYICRREDGELDLIVEAKTLDVNLDLRPSQTDPASRIPKIQLEEYLRKRPDSKHGVFGLLTNGEEWRVCRRIENDIVWLSSAMAPTSRILEKTLTPIKTHEKIVRKVKEYPSERGIDVLSKIVSASNHRDLIDKLASIENRIAHQTDLVSSYELSEVPEVSGFLFTEGHFVTIGSLANDGNLPIADIFEPLRETYLINPSITTIGVGIAFDEEQESPVACRIFVWDGSKLHTSNQFDPELPGTRVLRQLESLAKWRDGQSTNLIDLLNAITVQSEFYDEIATWFKRTGTELNDLRHLIRVLFAWFLKEHGVIPSELFEVHTGIKIHDQLEYLFTKTLSTEPMQRTVPLKFQLLKEVFENTPFLNGSLFNADASLLRSDLDDSDYISTRQTKKGLFTILKRYAWTLTENDQIKSDTALDPSMIGSVFERFVALAENITPGPLARQPDGTYYTPQDLTDEMVCDALAHDLTAHIDGITFNEALNLLHPNEDSQSHTASLLNTNLKQEVVKRLRKVTVLDPCTGSGEFIVSTLNTLRRAEKKLRSDYDDLDRIKHAIKNQLYAVDVNPIAIQVTRFRFYLAMVCTQLADRDDQGKSKIVPFPNLETRITAANSLATRLMQEELDSLGSELNSAEMLEWRNVRDSYTNIYSVKEKKLLRSKETRARKKLIKSKPHALAHVMEWLQNESLGNENVVAQCGLSFLFGKEQWDIVIGNPPYQKPTSEEKNVAAKYGYHTSVCGDLYCLFIELGINLTNDSGNVTMVVPHSICFADKKQTLRDICSNMAESIYLRTYNNRPVPVFPSHPFIKGGNRGAQSRQRVTVITIKRAKAFESTPSIHASCYIGLRSPQRKEILRRRPSYPQSHHIGWTMAGTAELARLLKEMRHDGVTLNTSVKSRAISFPPTAYYFLTCLPQEVLDSPRRKTVTVPDDELFWSHICLFNSTVFHAYWLMVGDAFDVLPRHFSYVRIPPNWILDSSMRDEANKIGMEFCSEGVLSRSATEFRQADKKFPNYDFHSYASDLVRKADLICLDGYGLKDHETELMDQIDKLRYFRTWDM